MKNTLFFGIGAFLLLVSSCGRAEAVDDYAGYNDTLTNHAAYLNMYRRPDGVVIADVANPWDKEKTLSHYALVSRDSVLPGDLPDNYLLISTPVERAAVFSSVHTGLMSELGVISSVAAIADAGYFPANDTIHALLASGSVADLGNSNNPSKERLVASRSEVVLRSPMNGVAMPQMPKGVQPVECADYMESTPIGRAEWMLFYGELFGKGDEARRTFDKVIEEYSNLVHKADSSSLPKPKILVETETSGVWYVPAGQSYAARLYADAGADYPWKDAEGQGSLALSLEEVAAKALDADMWLVRSYGYETTPQTLAKLNPRYSSFKAFKDGNVYSCDTEARNVFAETAFHPEYLLADYISIFHPDVMPGYQAKYFAK